MGITMLRFTPIYGGLLAILVVFLAYRVTTFRQKEKMGSSYGDMSEGLQLAIRAHANALENIPLALLLMLMLETNHLTPWLLNTLAVSFVIARIMHAWGLSKSSGVTFGRFWGTAITFLVMLAMAALNIIIIVTR
jgi:hypothetical protein